MVSVIMYMMHTRQDLQWIMMQGYQLSWFTKLLYYMDSQPLEDIEFVPKSIRGFDLGVRPYSGHISLWIGSLLIEVGGNRYSQFRHHDILWDWDSAPPWVIQKTCDLEIYSYSNSFNGIWHMLLEARVCQLIT